ncbi:MAG: PBS lyase HEAT protein [candidate division Zixibacteria bacterium RBG-1]|nr:MAG: PBS lyase HEAT protein [candidate division Zixibacteria bacterium RBG-1]OGC85195.1 MAG: hypothetical protein A2V73_01165 [candidate division Zixibacteria bacterium RBG_19FT_COMBO_42_43]
MPILDLKVNLKDLSENILRELYLAEKKLSFYTKNHPAIEKTLEKPFYLLSSFFNLKNSFVLKIEGRKIWACGILIPDSIATRALVSDFSVFNIQNVVILPQATISELYIFLNRLQEKIAPNKNNLDMSKYLKEQKVNTVLANTSIEDELFFMVAESEETRDKYQAERVIKKVLIKNPALIAEMAWNRFDLTLKISPDFRMAAYVQVIPEVINGLEEQILFGSLSKKVEENVKSVTEQHLRGFKILLKMFPDPGKKERMISRLKTLFFSSNLSPQLFESVLDETSKIKVKVFEKSEEMLEKLKTAQADESQLQEWTELFDRFIRLKQTEKLQSLNLALVSSLISSSGTFRQNSFSVLRSLLEVLSRVPDQEVSRHLRELLTPKIELPYVAQLLFFWTQKSLATRDYSSLAELSEKLQGKTPEIRNFLNQSGNLNQIMEDLKKSPQQKWVFKKILKFIGTPEVAENLIQLFTHPDRHLRQVSLSVLTEIGEVSERLFARMFADEKNWRRNSDGMTLNTSSWYKIRNTLHLWGRINCFNSWEILEQKISDTDPKVRREIAKTLEKIGGEKSIELLSTLVNDKSVSVKKTAILGLGLIGTPAQISLLKSLYGKDNKVALATIYAIKSIGGEEAKKFFLENLNNEKLWGKSLIIRDSGKKVIRAIVKALRQIPDPEVQQKLQQFQKSLTKTQKIFLNPKSLISN